MPTYEDRVRRIAELNDQARTRMGVGGLVLQSKRLAQLPPDVQKRLRWKVQQCYDRRPVPAPYERRMVGTIESEGIGVYWEILCLDPSMDCRSDDAADPEKTIRVLHLWEYHDFVENGGSMFWNYRG